MTGPRALRPHLAALAAVLLLAGCAPTWVETPLTPQAVQEACAGNPAIAAPSRLDQPPFITCTVTLADQAEVATYGAKRRFVCAAPGWRLGLVDVPRDQRTQHNLVWAGGRPVFLLNERDEQERLFALVPPGTATVALLSFRDDANERTGDEFVQRIRSLAGLPLSAEQAAVLVRALTNSAVAVDPQALAWLEQYAQDGLRLPKLVNERVERTNADWLRFGVECQKPSEWLWRRITDRAYAAQALFHLSGFTSTRALSDALHGNPNGGQGYLLTAAEVAPFVAGAKQVLAAVQGTAAVGPFLTSAVWTLNKAGAAETGLGLVAWTASQRLPQDRSVAHAQFRLLTGPNGYEGLQTLHRDELATGYAAVAPEHRLALAEALLQPYGERDYPALSPADVYRLIVANDLPVWVAGAQHHAMPPLLVRAVLRAGSAQDVARVSALGYILPRDAQALSDCMSSGNDALAARMVAETSGLPRDALVAMAKEAALHGMLQTLLQLEKAGPDVMGAKGQTHRLLLSGRRDIAHEVFSRWPQGADEAGSFVFTRNDIPWNEAFADEPGWCEELLAHGLAPAGSTGQTLLNRAVRNHYPNLLHSLAGSGLPGFYFARYLHPMSSDESEDALYRRAAALLSGGVSADQPAREDVLFYPPVEWAAMTTPLGSAIRKNYPRVARLLIAHGADPRQPVCGGKNAAEAIATLYPKPGDAQELRAAVAGQGAPGQ